MTGTGEPGTRPLQKGVRPGVNNASSPHPPPRRRRRPAVALGVTTAFVIGRDAGPAQPAAVASPTTTTTGDNVAQDGNDTTPATQPKPKPPVDRESRAAKAAAVAFMRDLGMRDPVAATYRKTGADTAEVGIHRSGEGLELDRVTTLVRLHRYTNGWLATGAQAVNTIEVDQPLPFTRIASPVTVSGQSVTYEGTVHVTVTEEQRGADRVLGRSFVNGGGTNGALQRLHQLRQPHTRHRRRLGRLQRRHRRRHPGSSRPPPSASASSTATTRRRSWASPPARPPPVRRCA